MTGHPTLLEARGITKLFGDFAANRAVSLTIRPGERHALLGENGAGKSTLVKMIYGVMQPTEGTFAWQGAETRIPSPAAARAMGIGMVFQHFSVFEALTVAENIALALPPEPMGALSARIADVSARYGLAIDPGRAVHTLSVGETQRVEIIRCLLQSPRLLIMDEPTSVLTPQEADALFETLRRLSEDGCAILYISHKLAEVTALCEAATILRHGKVVATCDPRAETPESMAERMVGERVAGLDRGSAAAGKVLLSVERLSLPAPSDLGVALSDVTLDVRGGEIVGIAGVAGEGQGALMAALMGEVRAPPGTVRINGVDAGGLGPDGRRAAGAAFVPEERNGHAAVGTMGLIENVTLTRHAEVVRALGFLDRGVARRALAAIREAFDVRADGADPKAGSLSGGNLQKFVVGREFLRETPVLVINQPTWGVDAGAAALIRQKLIDRAHREGGAVLVISQDLEELFAIADRIAVMYHGRLSPARPVAGITPEAVGLLMAGGAEPRAA